MIVKFFIEFIFNDKVVNIKNCVLYYEKYLVEKKYGFSFDKVCYDKFSC